jgi:hypothetical protein
MDPLGYLRQKFLEWANGQSPDRFGCLMFLAGAIVALAAALGWIRGC